MKESYKQKKERIKNEIGETLKKIGIYENFTWEMGEELYDCVKKIIDETEREAQKEILKPLIDISYKKTSAEVIGGQLYAMVKLLRENNKS